MLDENIEIEQKWNNYTKQWYENKGYEFTKNGDIFKVKIKDLTRGSKVKICPICDYCDNQYETSYGIYLQGHKIINKDCCNKCTGKKTSEVTWYKRASKYYKLAQTRCKELGYKLLTPFSEYTDVKMKLKIDIGNNNIQEVFLENFIHGHDCRINSYEKRNYNRLSVQEINLSILKDGNVWLNPQEYTNCMDRQLIIKCKCGNTFQTSYANYTRAGVNQCSICAKVKSKGEVLIENFLNKNNIEYIYQFRFEDCRDVKPLPFDFYLPIFNICIEYDGQGHYYPIFTEESYLLTVKHDNIKNNYCISNNIPLLRIPYFEIQNMEQKINMFLKQCV